MERSTKVERQCVRVDPSPLVHLVDLPEESLYTLCGLSLEYYLEESEFLPGDLEVTCPYCKE